MGKINRILSGNGFAIAVAFIHLLIVLRACQYCISGRDQDWPMVWVAFLFIDGPVFILSTIFPPYPRMNFFPGGPNAPLNDLNNFWIPALICGILGTVQWFYIGKILAFVFKRRPVNSSNTAEPDDKVHSADK